MEVQTSGKSIDSVLERVLCMNILSSDYFKELYRLKSYHDVVDEIYNQVDHVEPWMTGNCRGPSTAFCLLYKFFTMKLTVKQMQGLLDHEDSPYIRAVGFLYLRYVGDPRSLWGWFEQYITDNEEFSPGSNGKMTTMGVFVRDLLLDQYYFDTLFPRIPVPVMRQLVANLERLKLSTQLAGVTCASGRHSSDTARRPPSVKAALSVSFGQRAPHRASTRDSSPVRRGTAHEQRAADDQAGLEKIRESVDKDPSLFNNCHRKTGALRQRGRELSIPKERNGERVKLLGTVGQIASAGLHRDNDNEANIPCNQFDGMSSHRNRVGTVRRKRERERGKDVHLYSSRNSENNRDRRKRERERELNSTYSPARDKNDVDVCQMKTQAGLPTQRNSLGRLRGFYGDESSKTNDSNFYTSGSKGRNVEDVIHLGDGTWM